jgi:hypothetical protein
MDEDNLDHVDEEIDVDSIEVVDEEVEEPEQTFTTFEDNSGEVAAVQDPEPEQEETVESEAEEKAPEKKKKHTSLKTQFNKVQREKYQALNEIETLRKENERLQYLASQNAEAAMSHHDQSIELRLKQAKAAKAAAYDSADTEAMIKADEMFAEAMNQKAASDRWKSEQKYLKSQQERQQQDQQQYQQQQQQYDDYQEPIERSQEADSWLSTNTWFDSNSPDYNPDLAELAQNHSLVLEQKYALLGKADKVYSQEYFDEIDRYVADLFVDDEQEAPPAAPVRAPIRQVAQQPSRMNLNMKPVRQNLAPVGKTIKQAAPPSPNRVVLSAQEREFAKQMNLKPEEYAKYKLQISKSGRYGYEQNKR